MDLWMKRWIAFKRAMRKCDVIIQVIDSRDAWGTLNMSFRKYMSKMIIAASKIDIAESRLRLLPGLMKGYRWVAVSGKTGEGVDELLDMIRNMTDRRPIRVAVAGYPNVGKSSLMNRMSGKRSAKVSPVPGQTKNIQWISLGDIMLYDTPGVVPRGETGLGLVMKSAVSAQKIPNPEPIAHKLIEKNRDAVAAHYDVKIGKDDDAEKILERIAKRRGRILKGGELDLESVARSVINDYQRGRLLL